MQLRSAYDSPVSAIVLAEGKFGQPGGKTATGVLAHSEIFDVKVVIDSTVDHATTTAVLDRDDIDPVPVVDNLEAALDRVADPRALIIGVAPPGGSLPAAWEADIITAMQAGCDIVSGLHGFLSDQPTLAEIAETNDVRLFDVRKPPSDDAFRVADGSVDDVDAAIVLTVGTDCAIGKRTTTYELYQAATQQGYEAAWVATGQTGIMVGAQQGVALDRIPSDFVAGMIEQAIVDLDTSYDIIFVEGQGSLGHRAYSAVTLGILHGCWPDAVVLVTDPNRERRVYFEQWPVSSIKSEIEHVERLSAATVAAVSTWSVAEMPTLDVPIANVYRGGAKELLTGVEAVI